MFKKLLTIIPIAIFFGAVQVQAFSAMMPGDTSVKEATIEMKQIAKQEMDLTTRYANPMVNGVFKDNILLNLAYMSGKVHNASEIDWDAVRAPSTYEFTLKPGEVFAYHDDVLPQYEGRVVKGTNAHFGAEDGFVSDGLLFGDGVCHFASLINWAARDAGLGVVAPSNHNFATIPGIDPMYGTAIYYSPSEPSVSQMQNLYVENTFGTPVKLVFENTGDTLVVSVYK